MWKSASLLPKNRETFGRDTCRVRSPAHNVGPAGRACVEIGEFVTQKPGDLRSGHVRGQETRAQREWALHGEGPVWKSASLLTKNRRGMQRRADGDEGATVPSQTCRPAAAPRDGMPHCPAAELKRSMP
jgi:hypothetical protein